MAAIIVRPNTAEGRRRKEQFIRENRRTQDKPKKKREPIRLNQPSKKGDKLDVRKVEPEQKVEERTEQATQLPPKIEKQVLPIQTPTIDTPEQQAVAELANPLGIGSDVLGSAAARFASLGSLKTLASVGVGIGVIGGGLALLGIGGAAATTGATGTAKSAALTSGALAKLGLSTAAVGTLITAIGSYPFAGFIKEEALQTIDFGVTTALKSGDVEAAEQALALQEEILNPSVWSELFQKIPFANVLTNLESFYDAARIKATINRRLIDNMKEGGTPEEQRENERQQEQEDYQANIDYYNEKRREMVLWEQEAERAQREEEARFWRKEREAQRQKEAEDREAIANFWFEYRKNLQKLSEENRPSNLNFGIL